MPAPQQPNQQDNSTAILWTIAAIFALGATVWFGFKPQLVQGFLQLKLWEIHAISYFTPSLQDVSTTISNIDPSKVSFNDLAIIGGEVGKYIRIPVLVIISLFALIVYFSNSTRVFKAAYNMKTLVRAEKDNWPQIRPVLNLDLVKTDIDKGPWAMALTPMQFCKRYNLLDEFRRPPKEGVSLKDRNRIDVSLRRGKANKLFSVQLGPTWGRLEKMPPHIQALFGAFAARINNDTKASANLFLQINRSVGGSQLDFSGALKLCQKHFNTSLVQKTLSSHAYVLTVMASMLENARLDGVQPTADFLWLKPYDRRLWYMLNTVGRQTPFVEVAGPFAHWVAEKALGRKLHVPMIEEATRALEISLKEIIYKPDTV